MRAQVLAVAGLAAAVFAVATPAQAQTGSNTIMVKRGELSVTPYAGYMITTNFANGPLGTSLSSANGALYGAQLGLPLAPNASLVGGIAYQSGDLKVGVPVLGGIKAGTSVAWLYEGDLELRGSQMKQGAASGFTPFVQVGAGAIHRKLTALGVSATSTDFAINGGVGADFTVTPGLALRLMAKDYIGKATFDSGLAQTSTLNNVALMAGVKLSF